MNISITPEQSATNDYGMTNNTGDATDVAAGKSVEDLNSIFRKSEDADRQMFAEMRSNILMVAGEHYSKKNNRFWNRLRDSRLLNVNKKLRLTKNHVQRITKIYRNNLLKYTPGVMIAPQIDTEIQDVKSAELHQAVWKHIKKQTKFKKKVSKFAKSFIDIGEVATKIFYDETRGKLIGYGPKLDEEGNQLEQGHQVDMMGIPIPGTGQPIPDKSKPVFSGELVMEPIYAFNLLRDPDAKSIDDSKFLCIRKMIGYNELLAKIEDQDIKDKIEKSKDETFLVFDGANGKYEQSKNQVVLREFYFRPCPEYPKGYFYIATKEVIIWQGELPGGVFPICWEGFDEVETTPRKRSLIKQLRPYQAEINRAGSQAATHQVTLGDDKLIVNNSAKVAHGGMLPGVRVIKTNSVGANGGIHVLPGRAGEQFLGYISGQIDEMYMVANIDEEQKKKSDGSMDVWGTLYGSIRNKKEFSLYSDCFEGFLSEVCKTSLELARYHYPDTEIVQMIGKKELVNMPEFKDSTDLEYKIEIEPSTDDAESIMGRQMMINHALQFVGGQMEREDIGKMLKESPIGNFNKAFDDFTVDYDNAQNDILQLERGEMPLLNQYENIEYKIRSITHRMKQADFDFLQPQIQQGFQGFLQQCEMVEAEKVAKIQRAQSGFIPEGGGMITINGIKDLEGNVMRVPYSSLEWLVTKLTEQGTVQNKIEAQNQGAVADMSQMITQGSNTIPNL